jgi:hypothetical protein
MENWLPVVGWEGFYEVSDLGNVRSVDRIIHDCQGNKRFSGKFLTPWKHKSGHLYVSLRKNSTKQNAQVHRLVSIAFIGPVPDGKEVCHENGNAADNRLENLRYDTRANNIQDSKAHGTFLYGEKRPGAKLKEVDIVSIFEMNSNGFSITEIANKFNVKNNNISRILSGDRWSLTSKKLGLL